MEINTILTLLFSICYI